MPEEFETFPILPASSEDALSVIKNIIAFNQSHVPFTQQEMSIYKNYVIKKEDAVIAGINAYLYQWGIMRIDVLFVAEEYRKKGLGKKLLHHLEKEAKKMEVNLIYLDTFDFQAKDFYIKQGYELFGTLNDCPKNHKRYFLSKKLK